MVASTEVFAFKQGTPFFAPRKSCLIVLSNTIQNLLSQLDELERIAKWYDRQEASPSESETVAYLVAPLLRVLGWTPQKMAIEWSYIDVTLFDRLPRMDENVSVVIEVKKKNNSCFTAFEQARDYALRNRNNCKRLIVTDGIRYGAYLLTPSGDFSLAAYFNLTELKSEYPIYECKGVNEALRLMTPDWRE